MDLEEKVPKSASLVEAMMPSRLPRITIVTPSFNQADFLEETILSVLNQRYPNLEYMIFDGGSTDGSRAIIEKYASHLAYYEIEPDRGQTHAINKGLAKATGEVIAYLNSDDVYLPGALLAIGEYFLAHPTAEWVTGQCHMYGDGPSWWMKPPSDFALPHLVHECSIAQPATFWRRTVVERFGPFDEARRYNMDYEYWLRIMSGGVKLDIVPYPLAGFRLHPASKTVSESDPFREADRVLREEYRSRLTPRERRIEDRYCRRHQGLVFRGKRWLRKRLGCAS